MSAYRPGRPNKYNPTTGMGQKPPEKPGEYRIRDASGAIVYIGRQVIWRAGPANTSAAVSWLLAEREREPIEYKVADGRSTSRTRREHERQKIAQHNPPLNRSRGGEGRPAGK